MNKLLFLSGKGLSGVNAPIMNELEKKWSIVADIDPFSYSYLDLFKNAFASFCFNKYRWKIKYHEERAFQKRTPKAFLTRSIACNKSISELSDDYDIIFQLMSTFSPIDTFSKPYFIYIDRTQKVAEEYFPVLFERMSEDEKKELHKVVSNTFKLATRIFTFNDRTKESIINDYNISKDRVISVGFGVNLKPFPEVLKKKTLKIISVISDFERHAGRLCIETIKLIQIKRPDVEFVLVGEIDADVKNELKGNVQIIPNIPHNKLLNYYLNSMILLAPAVIGSAQSITEAMAYKCICVASSENPDAKGIIINEVNGFLIKGNTASCFSQKIIKLLSTPDILDSIGSSAHNHIRMNHTWGKVINKINFEIEKL